MVLVDEKYSGLDWNALLQKAEEGVKMLEEEASRHVFDPTEADSTICSTCGKNRSDPAVHFVKKEGGNIAIPNQTPQTGIEEMVGVSHAYYEKQLEEMGKLLEEAGVLMNQKVTPTPPIEVSRTESTPEEKDKELAMGFTRCSNCGAKVSDFQRACPRCGGKEFSEEDDEVKRLEEEIVKLEGEV